MAAYDTADWPDDVYDDHFLTLVAEEEARAVKRRRSLPTPATMSPTSQFMSAGNAPTEVEAEGAYMAALRGSKSSTWQQLIKRQGVGRGGERASGSPSGGRVGYADGGDRSGNACFKCGILGHWAKDCTEVIVGGGQGRGQREPASGGNQVPDKTCPCGVGVCAVFTSNTTKNPGRKFYRCPVKSEEGGCNFFEWCDSQPPSGCPTNTTSSPVSRNYSIQGGYNAKFQLPEQGGYNSKFRLPEERSRSACFKCGQEGHWSKDCPMQSSQSNADTGSSRPGSSSGTCFKCGKAGHWARDCTAQVSSPSVGSKRFSSSLYAGYK